jgi:hypothetical protein
MTSSGIEPAIFRLVAEGITQMLLKFDIRDWQQTLLRNSIVLA